MANSTITSGTLRMSLLASATLGLLILALPQNPLAQSLRTQSAPTAAEPAVAEPAGDENSVYIPKNLADSLVTLRALLKPDEIKAITAAKEADMAQFHMGLGTSLRNRWGLWRGSRLARHFNSLGIYHPDDMSGIILTSLWRQLHGQPLRLGEQISFYQNYWKAAQIADAQEKRRAAGVKAKIKRQMLGLKLTPARVPGVVLPQRREEGLSIRSLVRFRQGLLLTAKENRDSAHLPSGDLDFFTPPYYLDLRRRVISPLRVAEIERIEDAVVTGGMLFLQGKKGGRSRILGIGVTRRFLPAPPGRGWIRLGQSPGGLLAVRPHGIYRWTHQGWQTLCTTNFELPRAGVPPLQVGPKVYFRDEGVNEDDKRLSWLDLNHPKTLTYFDRDVGLVGSDGPRWENVHSFAASSKGSLWIATGSFVTAPSLVLRRSDGTYRIGLFGGSPEARGDLVAGDGPEAPGPKDTYITGVLNGGNDQTMVVGASGIYHLRGQSLQPMVRFGHTEQEIEQADGTLHWGWIPTHMVSLNAGSFVLGGHFGGTYLLNHTATGQFRLISLDENLGKPLSL